MTEPRVPDDDSGEDESVAERGDSGGGDSLVDLPCGERVPRDTFDLGMREYECACGARHAVVMDMHPPSRFLPEAIVTVLEEAVEPADEDAFEEFGTPHLMGAVLEETPDDVTVTDASGDGNVGYALLWTFRYDSRTLHEYVVELVVELMDHAVSHAEDASAQSTFEAAMTDFDAGEFVDAYRAQRDWEAERPEGRE